MFDSQDISYSALTLRNLRAQYPHLFYPQSWFDNEPFMDTPAERIEFPSFMQWSYPYHPAPYSKTATAASLCLLYVERPSDPIWEKYLWCADLDSRKQRVFIGKNDGKMEIHRFLHINSRFGVPTWEARQSF